jgi:hypothetical protein
LSHECHGATCTRRQTLSAIKQLSVISIVFLAACLLRRVANLACFAVGVCRGVPRPHSFIVCGKKKKADDKQAAASTPTEPDHDPFQKCRCKPRSFEAQTVQVGPASLMTADPFASTVSTAPPPERVTLAPRPTAPQSGDPAGHTRSPARAARGLHPHGRPASLVPRPACTSAPKRRALSPRHAARALPLWGPVTLLCGGCRGRHTSSTC